MVAWKSSDTPVTLLGSKNMKFYLNNSTIWHDHVFLEQFDIKINLYARRHENVTDYIFRVSLKGGQCHRKTFQLQFPGILINYAQFYPG